jgi:hypothetical protein
LVFTVKLANGDMDEELGVELDEAATNMVRIPEVLGAMALVYSECRL